MRTDSNSPVPRRTGGPGVGAAAQVSIAVIGLCLLLTPVLGAEIRTASLASPSLGREVAYLVDVPDSYGKGNRRYPVIYALHGLFEGPSFWERRGLATIFHEAVARGEFPQTIVVAVDGANSFFINGPQGRYEDLVVKDLVAHVESTYRTAGGRDSRALLGISMGGYGALRIAFAHPAVFGVVATHSAMLLTQIPTARAGAGAGHLRAFHAAFGNPVDAALWNTADPLRLATQAPRDALPALYFDCGAADRFGLVAGNTDLHRRLEARGINHEFALHPGDHGYEYVRSVLPLSLRFLAERLGLTPGP